jgi:hypothetical protein
MGNGMRLAGAVVVLLLSSVGPGFAAQGGMSGPAEKPSIFALPHSLTGEVVAVNQGTSVLTVRTAERTLSLKADVDTAPQLGSLKAGDRVTVSYKNSKGEMVAIKIVPA